MAGNPSRARRSEDYRRALANRVREKSKELEDLIFDRICALEEGSESPPNRSFGGLRPLIRCLIEYGAVALELGERQCPPPPAAALEHARKAAWVAASARLLPDRYLASRTVFNQFLRRESRSVDRYENGVLSQIQESNDVIFERLFRLVGDEFEQELKRKRRSAATKQLDCIRALLAGELMEAPDLVYRFEDTHIGVIGSGRDVEPAIRQLARFLDGQQLLVRPSPYRAWAWIGSSRDIESPLLEQYAQMDFPFSARLALGEPQPGLGGWRRTHRQARAAFPATIRGDNPVVRYSNVALLTATADDSLLSSFLLENYLAPLSRARDGGETLKATLRAYFSVDRQISSAATLLRVKRHTVRRRLDDVEALLGRRLDICAVELEVALRLEALHALPEASTPGSA